MVDTFRLMSQIRQDKYKQLTNEQLAKEYKKTNNQSLLAELFCKNFALISRVVFEPIYSYIDKEDKISSVLSSIYNAALNFEASKGYAFNTFVIKCIRTEFNGYIAKLSYKKRKVDKLYSLEAMCENMDNQNVEINFIKAYDDSYDKVELLNSIQNSKLSPEEKVMCEAIIQDCNITNNELAKVLSCHRHTVRHIKSSLKSKLVTVM